MGFHASLVFTNLPPSLFFLPFVSYYAPPLSYSLLHHCSSISLC